MAEENEEVKNLRANLKGACNMVQKELTALQELIMNPEKTEKEIIEALKNCSVGGAVACYLTVAENARRFLDLLEENEYSNYEIRGK